VTALPRLATGECKKMSEQTATSDKIINRHIARLLTNLEQANCPEVYVQAVKSELTWLRSDLKEFYEGIQN
jgi:hypothetical protein